jgi:hypothetical protein
MTGPQTTYLRNLCRARGIPFDETMNRGQAARMIDRLKRGQSPALGEKRVDATHAQRMTIRGLGGQDPNRLSIEAAKQMIEELRSKLQDRPERCMTVRQSAFLQELCREAGETFDPALSRTEARLAIDRLRAVNQTAE